MRFPMILLTLLPTSLFAQGYDIYLFALDDDLTLVARVTDRAGYDNQPAFTVDCESLMFSSDRAGGLGERDIWQGSIDRVVDLNADGIVDSVDMCIMVDNWGTNKY